MAHLSTERLASLIDEAPSGAETLHLRECEDCGQEARAYRALHSMASGLRSTPGAPLTSWASVSAGVREEGILPVVASGRQWSLPAWARVAAGLVLVAGGAAVGRVSAGVPLLATAQSPRASLAVAVADTALQFDSPEAAVAALAHAQSVATQASAYISANGSPDEQQAASGDVYETRLNAFNGVAAALLAGGADASVDDPVLNSYYLSALGERNATIQRMNRAPRSSSGGIQNASLTRY